jgi:hypothetical protein
MVAIQNIANGMETPSQTFPLLCRKRTRDRRFGIVVVHACHQGCVRVVFVVREIVVVMVSGTSFHPVAVI